MADPHIQSSMDFWDYLTVILYRTGFVVAAGMTLLLPFSFELGLKGLLVASVLLASSLHIYLKHFRLSFQFAVWLALLLYLFDFQMSAFGALLFTLGGLCYKEYFCFRVKGLNFQPVFVALLWLCSYLQLQWGIIIFSLISGALLLLLSIQKWKMPLHFDIGDKSKYQI